MIKKINKKIIMIILIILVISLSIGIGAYAAYVLNATEVQYTKSDGNTVSVKAALDELYNQNRFQTTNTTLFMGDKVQVGNEYFYVWTDSPKNDNHVTVICARPLIYVSSTSNYRQCTGNENGTALGWGTAYWSNVTSTSGRRYNLNGVSGYSNNCVMGAVKSYAISVGALDGRLPSDPEMDCIAAATVLNRGLAQKYSRMLAESIDIDADFWLSTCFVNYGDKSSLDNYDFDIYFMEDDWGTTDYLGYSGDSTDGVSRCKVKPILIFNKSNVSLIERLVSNFE